MITANYQAQSDKQAGFFCVNPRRTAFNEIQ
jgi:hypothetical protein